MRLRCFFLGCRWDEGRLTDIGQASMLCQRCARCGARRYSSAKGLARKGLAAEPEI